jgi:hypothetical protein
MNDDQREPQASVKVVPDISAALQDLCHRRSTVWTHSANGDQ